MCFSYRGSVWLFCVFVLLVYFLLFVLSCQYQCKWLPGETCLRNDPLCVERDVKIYSLTPLLLPTFMSSNEKKMLIWRKDFSSHFHDVKLFGAIVLLLVLYVRLIRLVLVLCTFSHLSAPWYCCSFEDIQHLLPNIINECGIVLSDLKKIFLIDFLQSENA